MSNPSSNYSGQNLTQPIYIDGSYQINPQIAIARPPFLLEKHDFQNLLREDNFINKCADPLLGSTIGLFINLIGKILGHNFDTTIIIDKWEYYAFLFSFILFIIVKIIAHYTMSERKQIIQKIQNHYNQ